MREPKGIRLAEPDPRAEVRCRGGRPGAATNTAASPSLQPVLDLIRQQYHEMIKYPTALRLGTADAESIVRHFTRDAPATPDLPGAGGVGQGLQKRYFCVGTSTPRRCFADIHDGLNVVENWNSANGFIFYGKGSEISTNRRNEQELAVLSLHLRQSSLVYITTPMFRRVLAEPSLVPEHDDRRSAQLPLIDTHVNPYGALS